VTVRISFLVPSAKHPIGGVNALFEFANGLRRLGHEVTLFHIDFIGDAEAPVHRLGDGITSLADISWFRFEPGIRQEILPVYDGSSLRPADVVVYLGGKTPRGAGLPLLVLQGYNMLPAEFERDLYRAPHPKICVATWLADVGRQFGVADEQLVHIPYGIQHGKYRITTPVDARPLQVSMLYNIHPTKAANVGLEALAELRQRIPELQVVVFGSMAPIHAIPEGITYLTSPDQDVIVADIYNQSRVFINTSIYEGFGMACVEAMACGCALVTTSNGGSNDYAFHGDTALVSEPGDVATMVEHVELLLRDDAQRTGLALAGSRYVQRFDWDESANRLEAFLRRYLDEPSRYRRPPVTPTTATTLLRPP
jgi:glycosyltransferase involved in cell wall biosynthesis